MTTYLERSLGLTPPTNPEVLGAVISSFARASETRTTAGDAHLVEALLRLGSVRDGLEAVGVDLDRARERVAQVIASLPTRPGLFARVRLLWGRSTEVDRLRRVRRKALAARLKELDGPFVLATIIGDSLDRDLLGALKSAGFSLLAYRRRVAHGEAVDAPCPPRGAVRVTIHNDPFTPMELVVSILTQIFERDEETARTLMKRTHDDGRAELATMDATIAGRRLEEARSRASKLDFPLRVTAVSVDG